MSDGKQSLRRQVAPPAASHPALSGFILELTKPDGNVLTSAKSGDLPEILARLSADEKLRLADVIAALESNSIPTTAADFDSYRFVKRFPGDKDDSIPALLNLLKRKMGAERLVAGISIRQGVDSGGRRLRPLWQFRILGYDRKDEVNRVGHSEYFEQGEKGAALFRKQGRGDLSTVEGVASVIRKMVVDREGYDQQLRNADVSRFMQIGGAFSEPLAPEFSFSPSDSGDVDLVLAKKLSRTRE